MSSGRVLESLNQYFDDFNVGDRIVSQSRELTADDIEVFSSSRVTTTRFTPTTSSRQRARLASASLRAS